MLDFNFGPCSLGIGDASQMCDSQRRPRSISRLTLTLLGVSFVASHSLVAQPSRATMLDFATGSELEEYVRALQVSGTAPHYPWSLRGFSRAEISSLIAPDSAGPWKLHHRLTTRAIATGPLTVGATFNSAYPYGGSDGPIWAGRGLTVGLSGGVAGHAGRFSVALAPI